MNINDPIGDLITRIRNAQMVGHESVLSPGSKARENFLEVLKREGFIRGYTTTKVRPDATQIKVELKYRDGEPAICEIKRVSKPGRRLYSTVADLPRYYNGLGISILSTSKGVISDAEAREANIGGEIMCSVF